MRSYWRLPRGVDELLPPNAWELEVLRRRVIDLFVAWGFDYIDPPLIEYLDSLLIGSGSDLDLQTLKVVDQVSGRQLGVRADMTSQAVRVDAHSRPVAGVQRLCYAGPVVYANPQISYASRIPLKAGAEIFGCDGLTADAEIIQLMLNVVVQAGISKPVLLLGDMGVYRALEAELLAAGDLRPEDREALFQCVQRKSEADIKALLGQSHLSSVVATLPNMLGDQGVFDELKSLLAGASSLALGAIDRLQSLALSLTQGETDVAMRIDVSELSGYGYHNGPVFAVYHPTHGQALAQGGRYDGIGSLFGRGRAATGFDIDLKRLITEAVQSRALVFAPFCEGDEKKSLMRKVAELRNSGLAVRVALNAADALDDQFTAYLTNASGQWQLVELPQ